MNDIDQIAIKLYMNEKISLSDVKNLIETDIMKNFINTESNALAMLKDNIYFDSKAIVDTLKNNYVDKNIDIINSFIENYNKRVSDLSNLRHIIESLKDSDLDLVYKNDDSIFLEFNFVNDLKIEFMSDIKQPLGTFDRTNPFINIYLDNIKVATFKREKIENDGAYIPYIENINDYTLLLMGLNPSEHNINSNKNNKTPEEESEHKKVNHMVNLLSVFTQELDNQKYRYRTIEPKIKNITLIHLLHPEYVLDLKTKNELELESLLSNVKPNQIQSIHQLGQEASKHIKNLQSQIKEINYDKKPSFKNR